MIISIPNFTCPAQIVHHQAKTLFSWPHVAILHFRKLPQQKLNVFYNIYYHMSYQDLKLNLSVVTHTSQCWVASSCVLFKQNMLKVDELAQQLCVG
jgi:hypothetical protein